MFLAQEKKEGRKTRRIAQKLDRSKFKKTDQKPQPSATLDPNLSSGRVLSITGEGSWVESDGKIFLCSIKGFLKKESSQKKNLLAVGDRVFFAITGEKEGSISQIAPRTSCLTRTDISGKKEQILAANVDLLVIVVSLHNPPLKPALVDRYWIAAEKGNLQPLLVIHKIDLLDSASEVEKELFALFLAAYEPLGIPLLATSTKNPQSCEALAHLLQGKTAVFSGQSGVGKSSLLNALFGFELKTGELTAKTAKGAHTTSRATLLPLPQGGYCIDTPGIRSFAIWKLTAKDVRHHFQEFTKFRCKFPDCTHRQEQGCAIHKAIEKGKISPLRLESYHTLLEQALSPQDSPTWG